MTMARRTPRRPRRNSLVTSKIRRRRTASRARVRRAFLLSERPNGAPLNSHGLSALGTRFSPWH